MFQITSWFLGVGEFSGMVPTTRHRYLIISNKCVTGYLFTPFTSSAHVLYTRTKNVSMNKIGTYLKKKSQVFSIQAL